MLLLTVWDQADALPTELSDLANKSGVNDLSINTCQDNSDGMAWNCSELYTPKVEDSIPGRGGFNFFAKFK